jgi:hypothetical protein
MIITQKYVEFILEYLGDSFRAELLEPREKGTYAAWKTGPIVYMPVKIEVLNKYTRSANLRLSFDKYKVDDLFFMPLNSSPDSILNKTNKKINKIVNKTLIDDGREDEIRKMYADKRAFIAEQFIKAQGKIAELNKNNSEKLIE